MNPDSEQFWGGNYFLSLDMLESCTFFNFRVCTLIYISQSFLYKYYKFNSPSCKISGGRGGGGDQHI